MLNIGDYNKLYTIGDGMINDESKERYLSLNE